MIILVVDDRETSRGKLASRLTERNHQVFTAADGLEALESLRAHTVDLVISDVLMPRLDGFQLCRRIKTDSNFRHIPFIFHTTSEMGPEEEELAARLGACLFFRNPDEPEEFLRQVEAVLPRSPQISVADESITDNEMFLIYGRRLLIRLEEEVAALRLELAESRSSEGICRQTLEEKETLLREVHHRVKNNMQVISSLLNLQAHQVEDPRLAEVLEESRQRVLVMALVHETLYRSGAVGHINFADYLKRLVSVLSEAHGTDDNGIRFVLELESVDVPVDYAIPCGLALNELISNALKHGFPNGGPGEVRLSLHKALSGRLEFEIKDNGIGLPSGMDWRGGEGLGLTLVIGLIERQLGGKVEVEVSDGTLFRLTYPLE